MSSILLLDDEDHFRERLARAFAKRGFSVWDAPNVDAALALVREHHPEMAVVDLKMEGRSGLDFVREALVLKPDLKIVILTGYGSITTAIEAGRMGVVCYLPKPADVNDIIAAFGRDPDVEVSVAPEDITTPSLARVEWEHINRVLADCGGNISVAAKRLNIHRRTLQRKLEKFPPLI